MPQVHARRSFAPTTLASGRATGRSAGPAALLLLSALLAGCLDGAEVPPGDAGAGTDLGGDARPGGTDTGKVCDPYAARPEVPQLFVGPMEVESMLLPRIAAAKKTLDVLMYEMSQPSFLDALIAAQGRGVKVRVVLDGKQDGNGVAKMRLPAAGVALRFAPERFSYAHAKILIIDGVEGVVMSANMDDFSAERSRNYGVIDRDPDDLLGLQTVFQADFAGAADPDLSCTRLLVSPINSLERLRGLISGAKRRLDMQLMYLSERSLVEAVKAKIAAGVPVRILLATPGFVSGNDVSAKDLIAAGAKVQYFYNNHAKLIVGDDTAFIGSENMSFTSLTKNREVGVFVTEKVPAAAAASQFETDWLHGVKVN